MKSISDVQTTVEKISGTLQTVILGKSDEIRLILAAMLAGRACAARRCPGYGKDYAGKSSGIVFQLRVRARAVYAGPPALRADGHIFLQP